ncbi:MAG: hypothetical protein ACM4AI_09545 [Acidobacteriota bacterium]
MGVIAVLTLVGKPAIRPNLGGLQNLLAGPQDNAHRFIVEYEREACHAPVVGKEPAKAGNMQLAVL